MRLGGAPEIYTLQKTNQTDPTTPVTLVFGLCARHLRRKLVFYRLLLLCRPPLLINLPHSNQFFHYATLSTATSSASSLHHLFCISPIPRRARSIILFTHPKNSWLQFFHRHLRRATSTTYLRLPWLYRPSLFQPPPLAVFRRRAGPPMRLWL